jgi:hypothetical protein
MLSHVLCPLLHRRFVPRESHQPLALTTPSPRNDRSWYLIWVRYCHACTGPPPKHDHDAVPTDEDIWRTEMSTLVDLERERSEQARRAAPHGDQGTSWMKRVGDTLRGADDCTSVLFRHPTNTYFVQ